MAQSSGSSPGSPSGPSSGQSPEQIQREIEQTRAELASTVEQIADRVSPKKVASRGAVVARDKVEEVFAKQVPATGPGQHGTRLEPRWERVGAVAGGLLLLLLARRRGKRKKAEAPRKAALQSAIKAAQQARKEQAEQQRAQANAERTAASKGRTTAQPLGKQSGKRADRARAEIELAIADLHEALDRQPGGR